MKKIIIVFICLFASIAYASKSDGERLFKAYCWGCHHQTSAAFGPSFKEIANSRNKGEIIAHIYDPQTSYKSLGYSRSSMPSFKELNAKELDTLADYILRFKDER